jgi:inosine-uridine nucleoside N-ribohydrolase
MDKKKIFIDTDICDDIDDLWALLLVLNVSEFEVIGISLSNGFTVGKARFVCKLLTELDLSNIPIFIGKKTNDEKNTHIEYIGDYQLSEYQGKIYYDFNSIKAIFMANETVNIIALGPLTNIKIMCEIYPEIASTAKLVLMGGAFYKGYINQDYVAEEFNVLMDITAFRYVSEVFDDLVIAPLDVCRDIVVSGDLYKQILSSKKKSIEILLKNYRIWDGCYSGGAIKYDHSKSSTILYDLIPVLYLISSELFVSRKLNYNVLDTGVTEVNKTGKYQASILIDITDKEKLYEITNKYLLKGDLN